MLEAGQFIATIEHRQGMKVACLEEIAFGKRWIGIEELARAAQAMNKTSYGLYLQRLVAEDLQR